MFASPNQDHSCSETHCSDLLVYQKNKLCVLVTQYNK
jgi:hypothetical protein